MHMCRRPGHCITQSSPVLMAKIHPKTDMVTQHLSSERQVFTVWMKSLVMNGNGCTVFNSRGELVFRVDNYQTRCCSEALLMDRDGQVLFSIKTKKKALVCKSWEVHKWINSKLVTDRGDWFRVRRKSRIFGRDITCHVILGCDKSRGTLCSYKIEGHQGKSMVNIIDGTGRVLAEVMQKQSRDGVHLGDDVLSLMVEPQIDQSLIMALVIVYAMINHKL